MKARCIKDHHNENSFAITINNSYEVYGTKQDAQGIFYLVLADDRSDYPQWLPADLYAVDDPSPSEGWIKREKQDSYGKTVITCSYPTYFEAEEDIIKGTGRGVRMFAHMRAYPGKGFGVNHQFITEMLAKASPQKDDSRENKEYEMQKPNEDEMLYLARVIAKEVIDISSVLPEIMQWRLSSALQGDVYDMASGIAAAKGAVDDYAKRAELESARTKAFVVKNAVAFLPAGRDTEALSGKIDQLVSLIDTELKTTDEAILAEEQEDEN